MMTAQRTYQQLLDDIAASVGTQSVEPAGAVGRAAAMLAGRVGCRIREAQAHVERLAREQGREPGEVAVELISVLESQSAPGGERRAHIAVDRALGAATAADSSGSRTPRYGDDGLVQQALDALPGAYAWLGRSGAAATR
jgi:hypothetical protein